MGWKMASIRCRFGGRNWEKHGTSAIIVRLGEVTVREACHQQQMLRESGIAAAISTFLPPRQGDSTGADLGRPEWLHAADNETAPKRAHTWTCTVIIFFSFTGLSWADMKLQMSAHREIHIKSCAHSDTSDDRCSWMHLNSAFRLLSAICFSPWHVSFSQHTGEQRYNRG